MSVFFLLNFFLLLCFLLVNRSTTEHKKVLKSQKLHKKAWPKKALALDKLDLFKSCSEYCVKNPIHSLLPPCSRQKVKKILEYLARQDPHTRGFRKLISNPIKFHS